MATTKHTDVDVRRDHVPDLRREEDDGERNRLLEEKPFDFIERTKPEDRLADTSHHGQLTRDNVNPNIPSVTPDQLGPAHARVQNPGGIVDPRTLGMESTAGVNPPGFPAYTMKPEGTDTPVVETHEGEPMVQGSIHSINEPPGSVPGGEPTTPGTGGPPVTSDLPLELDSISPEMLPLQPEIIETIMITATGKGFTTSTVMLFDDEEVPTEVLSETSLRGTVPTIDVAGIYDVELQRGDDLSDVLTFEFVDAHADENKVTKKPTQRKPAKAKDAPRKPAKAKGKR